MEEEKKLSVLFVDDQISNTEDIVSIIEEELKEEGIKLEYVIVNRLLSKGEQQGAFTILLEKANEIDAVIVDNVFENVFGAMEENTFSKKEQEMIGIETFEKGQGIANNIAKAIRFKFINSESSNYRSANPNLLLLVLTGYGQRVEGHDFMREFDFHCAKGKKGEDIRNPLLIKQFREILKKKENRLKEDSNNKGNNKGNNIYNEDYIKPLEMLFLVFKEVFEKMANKKNAYKTAFDIVYPEDKPEDELEDLDMKIVKKVIYNTFQYFILKHSSYFFDKIKYQDRSDYFSENPSSKEIQLLPYKDKIEGKGKDDEDEQVNSFMTFDSFVRIFKDKKDKSVYEKLKSEYESSKSKLDENAYLYAYNIFCSKKRPENTVVKWGLFIHWYCIKFLLDEETETNYRREIEVFDKVMNINQPPWMVHQ